MKATVIARDSDQSKTVYGTISQGCSAIAPTLDNTAPTASDCPGTDAAPQSILGGNHTQSGGFIQLLTQYGDQRSTGSYQLPTLALELLDVAIVTTSSNHELKTADTAEKESFVDSRQAYLKRLSPEVLRPVERLPSEEREVEEERLFETSLPEGDVQAAHESFERAHHTLGEHGVDAGEVIPADTVYTSSYGSYGSYDRPTEPQSTGAIVSSLGVAFTISFELRVDTIDPPEMIKHITGFIASIAATAGVEESAVTIVVAREESSLRQGSVSGTTLKVTIVTEDGDTADNLSAALKNGEFDTELLAGLARVGNFIPTADLGASGVLMTSEALNGASKTLVEGSTGFEIANNGGHGYSVGDQFKIGEAADGWTTPALIEVLAVGEGGAITEVTLVEGGSFDGPGMGTYDLILPGADSAALLQSQVSTAMRTARGAHQQSQARAHSTAHGLTYTLGIAAFFVAVAVVVVRARRSAAASANAVIQTARSVEATEATLNIVPAGSMI
jgi:hypothetical protein